MASFKMPEFDPERVERFFDQADDRFLALGIYHPVLKYTALTPYLPGPLLEAVATRHAEFARSEDRYEALRLAVVEYTYRPFWAQHHAVDALPSVSASMSPSQLMLKLIALKGPDHEFCDAFRYQFLKRLPTHLFEKHKDKEWDRRDPIKFAHMVERHWAPTMAGPTYHTVPAPGHHGSTNGAASGRPVPPGAPGQPTTVAQVEEEDPASEHQEMLDVLRPLVAALQTARRGGQSNRRGSRRGNFSQGRNNNGNNFRQGGQQQNQQTNNQAGNQGQNRANNSEWCYFHQRFGNNATNCRPPCAYNQRTSGNVRTLQYETSL